MFWVSRTNDSAYRLSMLRKSSRLVRVPRRLCVRVDMGHGHVPGWSPKEIDAYTDSLFRGSPPPPIVTGQGMEAGKVWATFGPEPPVVRAELNFTADTGTWPQRQWQTVPAHLDAPAGLADADVPANATALFLNLLDARGLIVSAEHHEP